MRTLLCMVMLGALAASSPVSAQVPGIEPDRTILIAPPPKPPSADVQRVAESLQRLRLSATTAPADLVRRILSFDADGDARVTEAELPERMQEIVRRADKNADGWLTEEEIRAAVDIRRTVRTGNVVVRTSVPGLEGVIHDLKLPPEKREQALAIVKGRTTVRNLNEGANGDVDARMRALLDDEEYENFVAAARRLSFSTVVVSSVVGGATGVKPATPAR